MPILIRKTLIFFLTLILILTPIHIHAQEGGVAPGETLQTNPKPRTTTINARVLDSLPPSTPILISPENNSVINTNKPTFVWQMSGTEGTFDLQNFDLYLDGTILFSGIPTYSVDTNAYTLTYDAVNQRYSLVPKNSLSDGVHTWRIVARDTNNNTSSSVTWSFTIDTTTPYLILTQIGTVSTSISSQDLATVPITPVVIYETSPLLKGTGEPGAKVTLSLSFSNNNPSQTYTFTINSDGTWQVQLTNLPLNVTMYLDFTITDAVGNIAFLSDVPFVVRARGTQPLPSGTPAPTAEPNPTDPFPIPLPSPLPPIPNPLEPLPFPFPFEQFTSGFLERIRPITDATLLDNFIVLLLIIVILLSRFIMLLAPLRGSISISAVQAAFRSLFFLPFSKQLKRGLVFDHLSGKPVPYAPIHFFYHQDSHIKHETTIFTDKHGYFYHLPGKGTYTFSIEQPSCLFPTTYPRPETIPISELYKGEQLLFEKNTFPVLFIPVDRYEGVEYTKRERLLLSLHLVDRPSNLLFFSLSVILTILFPTLLNILTILLYGLVLVLFYLDKKRSVVTITTYNTDKNPVDFVLIKAKLAKSHDVIDFMLTDIDGNAHLELTVDEYRLDPYKLHWQSVSVDASIVLMTQKDVVLP